jgi:predicted nucleic acid-binding protein
MEPRAQRERKDYVLSNACLTNHRLQAEVENLLYPNEAILRDAMRGCAAYQLNWFDAHRWSYAEHYGLAEIISEDLQHDRLYGSVRVVNPFAGLR